MTQTEQICRAFIVAARAIAVLVFVPVGCLGLIVHDTGPPYWQQAWDWETAGLVSFLGYAVFIMLPLQRFRGSTFWLAIAVGAVLALGSMWTSKDLYDVGKVLEGAVVYHAIAWLLLIPIYAYIPVMVLNRKHGAANNRLNSTTEGTPSAER